MIAMIGTSDRLCWLAETCKILLVLLLPWLGAFPHLNIDRYVLAPEQGSNTFKN